MTVFPVLEFETYSVAETQALGNELGRRLFAGDIVALDGTLGAGKTCFVRGLAQGLGLKPEVVSSPTFIICQEYRPEGANAPVGGAGAVGAVGGGLVHIDAYRLRSEEELDAIGWNEMLAARDSVIAVEWPQRMGGSLSPHRIDVHFDHVNEHTRLLRFSSPPSLMNRLQGLAIPADLLAERAAQSPCPMCANLVDRTVASFPFCSNRCRMADLGKWLRGDYRISRELRNDDDLE